jgi:hypothetical protein
MWKTTDNGPEGSQPIGCLTTPLGGGVRPQNDIHQSNTGKCGTPNDARREGTDTVQKKEGIGCVRDFRTVHKRLE